MSEYSIYWVFISPIKRSVNESFLSDAFAGREGQTPPFKGRAHAAPALCKTTLIVKKNMPGKLFFFNNLPVPLYCTYILCTQGRCNILLIEDLVRLRAQKHNITMASAASPRAADPKMVESPDSMVHVSSSYACAEDGYFKRPHTASTDGDILWDSCCFLLVLK